MAVGDNVPPTDSRFRPDQRALENGQIQQATYLKKHLEDVKASLMLIIFSGIGRSVNNFSQSFDFEIESKTL